jgi:hypothetical protein
MTIEVELDDALSNEELLKIMINNNHNNNNHKTKQQQQQHNNTGAEDEEEEEDKLNFLFNDDYEISSNINDDSEVMDVTSD